MIANSVAVTPLLPLLGEDGVSYVDRMTSIVRPHGALRLPSHGPYDAHCNRTCDT